MSLAPMTCSADLSVGRIAQLMIERKIDSLPVVGRSAGPLSAALDRRTARTPPERVWPMDTRESWKIDGDRSTLTFRLPHTLLGDIHGRFGCWGGRVLVDPAKPQRFAVRIWVELSSIDTGSRRCDEEILNTELFAQRWEPALEFDGDLLEIGPSAGITLAGWLSLRGLRKRASVTIDAPWLGLDPSGRPRLVCTARASLDRQALGLRRPRNVRDWLSDRLLDETIEIVAHVEAAPESAFPALPLRMTLDALLSHLGSAGRCVPLTQASASG
jgi:polyisoprenoid-binding protein YceI